jgi:ABC-type multidrug transport system fused ATPase/permease subunit
MLIIVLSLAAGVVLLSFVRSMMFLKQTLHASQQLHEAMLSAVLRAKIEFFDTNPSGRVLNRFSADVGSNDVSSYYNLCFDITATSRLLLQESLIILS